MSPSLLFRAETEVEFNKRIVDITRQSSCWQVLTDKGVMVSSETVEC